MNIKVIKTNLNDAVKIEGKDTLITKLIKGELEAEGIFFQEHMTEAQENAEDFQTIPRSAWINYEIDINRNQLKCEEYLDHYKIETSCQFYSSIYVLMPNEKESVKQIKKQTRIHQHHEIIGRVALKLRKEGGKNPKGDDVWDYFEKNWEEIDDVIDMNDLEITFTTTTGKSKPIVKSTIANITSDYLSGKKTLV